MGNNALATHFVAGYMRVPQPAIGITAFRTVGVDIQVMFFLQQTIEIFGAPAAFGDTNTISYMFRDIGVADEVFFK